MLGRLRDVASAAVEQLSGGPAVDLLDMARDLDTALDDLRRSTRPLTHPDHPAAGPAAHRQLSRGAAGDLRLPRPVAGGDRRTGAVQHDASAADPRLARAGRRIAQNIDVIIARVLDENADAEVVVRVRASPRCWRAAGSEALRSGTVTFRVLRHLQRLDEGVVGLARPLDVPVAERAERAGDPEAA